MKHSSSPERLDTLFEQQVERTPDAVAVEIGATAVSAQIVNSYGPTECTEVVSVHRVQEPQRFANANIPIGAPVPGFALHVLDESLRPVPAFFRTEISSA